MEMEDSEITPALLEKEQQAQFNSCSAFRQEEEYWRLKSRSTWLKEGDRNTSFCHKQYRARISQNHISKITSLSGVTIKAFLKSNKLLKYISKTCTKKMDSLILIKLLKF